MNRFGQRVRQLRLAKGMSLRDLAPKVGVGFTYLSKVETGRLDFGKYPSEALIHKLAEALEGDEDELLLLAEKIPEQVRARVLQTARYFPCFRCLRRRDARQIDGADQSDSREDASPERDSAAGSAWLRTLPFLQKPPNSSLKSR